MLLLFLFFPRGVFIHFSFHRHSRARGEADHSAEVFSGDFRLYAPRPSSATSIFHAGSQFQQLM